MANDDQSLLTTLGLPMIQSAGGLVYNDNYHILLIFKRGRWNLPKCQPKSKGESQVKAAIREVNEETGLDESKLRVEGKIVSTWHFSKRKKHST